MKTALLDKLSQASLNISALQPESNIYDAVCTLAIDTFGLKMVWLGVVPKTDVTALPISGESPEEFGREHFLFTWGFLNSDPTGISLTPLEESAVEGLRYPDEHLLILDQGTCWVINDIEAHEQHHDWRETALWLGFHSALGQPLIGTSGDMLGVMHLYSEQQGFFTIEMLDAIRIFANMAASAIEIRRLVDRLQDKVRELEGANRFITLSEKRYHDLFISMRDVVVIADFSRCIIDVNQPAMRSVFGYETDELIGCNTAMLYADAVQYEMVGKAVFDLNDAMAGKLFDIRFRRKSGELFEGELFAMKMVSADGSATGNIGVIRDISDRKNMEAQFLHAQKMESIGTLAGGVAHDFNNILTAIIGYGEMSIMKLSADDPLRQNIQNMLDGCQRAARLTRDLLLFSRKQGINKKQVDINEVILKVQKFLRKVIGEDIDFKAVIHAGQMAVMADEFQLEQVLMNMATNARDAMPQGGKFTVTTELVRLDKAFVSALGYGETGDYALIRVRDSGCGMDKETRLRVFEPFFTTKEVGKGTGLGLAVVYGIIKQHKGFIDLQSALGAGSEFKIYLPLVESGIITESGPVREEKVVGGSETILLAEDDDAVRALAKDVLTEHGYTVIEAADGVEAVKRFAENYEKIDLLLLDLIMPNMSGSEALEVIRKVSPQIRAVFFSGYSPEIVQQRIAQLNGVALIAKPVSPDDLLRKVRRVLDGAAILP